MSKTAARFRFRLGAKCPQCGAPTRRRQTRQDNQPFWGGTGYPACRGVVDYEKNR